MKNNVHTDQLRILILYNEAKTLKKGSVRDLSCEQEILIIVPLVEECMRANGFITKTLKTSFTLWEELKSYRSQFDLVLNLAEGFGGENKNETLIPAMLEALEIPFTGASSFNMHMTLDKEVTKLLVNHHGVPVAEHQIFRSETDKLGNLPLPAIVKPIREEASIGIHDDSVVINESALQGKVSAIRQQYHQAAIVERYIAGREISVGIIGNGNDLHVLPPLEFIFSAAVSELQAIRSYRYKWESGKETMVRARLNEKSHNELVSYSQRAFVCTECRDYARVDYRLDAFDNIYLLEVNYNPGIGPNSHGLNNTLTMMAEFAGISWSEMLTSIVSAAAKREGLL